MHLFDIPVKAEDDRQEAERMCLVQMKYMLSVIVLLHLMSACQCMEDLVFSSQRERIPIVDPYVHDLLRIQRSSFCVHAIIMSLGVFNSLPLYDYPLPQTELVLMCT